MIKDLAGAITQAEESATGLLSRGVSIYRTATEGMMDGTAAAASGQQSHPRPRHPHPRPRHPHPRPGPDMVMSPGPRPAPHLRQARPIGTRSVCVPCRATRPPSSPHPPTWGNMVKLPSLGSAPARPLCLLWTRLAALGSSALPGRASASGTPATASGARASRITLQRALADSTGSGLTTQAPHARLRQEPRPQRLPRRLRLRPPSANRLLRGLARRECARPHRRRLHRRLRLSCAPRRLRRGLVRAIAAHLPRRIRGLRPREHNPQQSQSQSRRLGQRRLKAARGQPARRPITRPAPCRQPAPRREEPRQVQVGGPRVGHAVPGICLNRHHDNTTRVGFGRIGGRARKHSTPPRVGARSHMCHRCEKP